MHRPWLQNTTVTTYPIKPKGTCLSVRAGVWSLWCEEGLGRKPGDSEPGDGEDARLGADLEPRKESTKGFSPVTALPHPTLVPLLTQQSAAGLPCWSLITGLFSGSLNLLEEFGPLRESSLRKRPTQQPPSPNVRERWAVKGPGSQRPCLSPPAFLARSPPRSSSCYKFYPPPTSPERQPGAKGQMSPPREG